MHKTYVDRRTDRQEAHEDGRIIEDNLRTAMAYAGFRNESPKFKLPDPGRPWCMLVYRICGHEQHTLSRTKLLTKQNGKAKTPNIKWSVIAFIPGNFYLRPAGGMNPLIPPSANCMRKAKFACLLNPPHPHRGLPPCRGGGAYAPMTRTIFNLKERS